MTHIDNLLEHFKGLDYIQFVEYTYEEPFTNISYDNFLEKRSNGEWDCYVLQWDCFIDGLGCLVLQVSNWKF